MKFYASLIVALPLVPCVTTSPRTLSSATFPTRARASTRTTRASPIFTRTDSSRPNASSRLCSPLAAASSAQTNNSNATTLTKGTSATFAVAAADAGTSVCFDTAPVAWKGSMPA
ncbi:uncharacterized protein PFL1_04639 [Pseudozyma flocculosa PF-1]|uniref:Uncharacterized protein n=1 Tax=Pseudozyma flocculosa PF-1 TaxID=1277687 RepID=A0A061H7A2_9BASI|nr:uncharacterized protein PFL1_04639 [Pseudozyma flocculosa PF-1]EPQ27895.1 hypothetical protein PFL1_04639 [Pseudozyma flocculosa PF-1]